MSIAKKLAFSLLAVIVFFGSAEGILRLTYQPSRPFNFYTPQPKSIVQPDADLGYRLRPNFEGKAYLSFVKTNSLGFRGPEFAPNPRNGLRVVAIGDSCTFGFGVSDNEHTYPFQLSTLMQNADVSAEVINAGVVGYSSYQALKLLQSRVLSFHPDILLIYIGWNDMGNSLSPDWTPTFTQGIERSHFWSNSPPYLLLALADVISRFRPRRPLAYKTAAVDSYSINLTKIVDVARQAGIEPMLISWPTRVALHIDRLRTTEVMPGSGITYDQWFDFYQRYQVALRAVAAAKNVKVIPLADDLNQKDSSYYIDEIHLSDQGNSEAAAVIFDSLRPEVAGRRLSH